MKIVLNKCYGGFELSEFACEKLGCDPFICDVYNGTLSRTDERLIDLIETYGSEKCGADDGGTALTIVEIPDETTDWEIGDYDGIETVTYVVDGKLYHA